MKRFVIIGAPNVGKSSLFNRLVGGRDALTYDQPGVTRDYLTRITEWRGRYFELVDTGGLYRGESDLESFWRRSLSIAKDADVILFVVDASRPLTTVEYDIATDLRKMGKPTVVIGNKMDLLKDPSSHELYTLGFENVQLVSATTGRNTGDLLDLMWNFLSDDDREEPVKDISFHVAVIGRTNAGKSTLMNKLLGIERVLVSDMPGTTLDFVSETINIRDTSIEVTDTPGLRKGDLRRLTVPEMLAVKRLENRLRRQQVLLHVVDAPMGLTALDEKVIRIAEEEGIGYIAVLNKIDLAKNPEEAAKVLSDAFTKKFPWVNRNAVVPASAIQGYNIDKIRTAIRMAQYDLELTFKSRELTELIKPLEELVSGYKFYYAVQVSTLPAVVKIFANKMEMPGNLLTFLRRELKKRMGQKTALPKVILEKS
ncbi:ribosome biogenesis GTPase Der [Coprothermobacter platensis]|uniref:ribosome biogenesis GTPase Der n=1 Tax=Coprothermobacter platensis TaxID=108819 RepID=UPI00036F82F9|nr:ribosome biogenesis GTPase Der [Coprothermobacter platensis]